MAISAAAVLVFVGRLPEPRPMIPVSRGEFDRAYWTRVAEERGSAQAYAAFTDAYADDAERTHAMAHLMGDIMFEQEGADALLLCDGSFGFGCYHQVSLRAVLEAADPSEVGSLCSETVSAAACAHGLGHGLAVAYRGQLDAAFLVCQGTVDRASACARGVFMEWLVPIEARFAQGGNGLIPPDPDRPYVPCEMTASFRPECYFSLPQWWFAHARSIGDVLALCESAPLAVRLDCFAGIGITLPALLGYDRRLIADACRAAASAAGADACIEESMRTLASLQK